jgi:hydrogenase maturation protein HypF
MLLEARCASDAVSVPLPLAPDDEGVLRSDWAPLLPYLLDEQRSAGERAMSFHVSLAQALLDQARMLRDMHGEFVVGLSGGVFQNRVLTERVMALLSENGFEARFGVAIPCNDAGISFGQIIESVYCVQPGRN